MPGMRCTVAVCSNSRINAIKYGKTISFYRFPKDKKLQQIWIQRCERDGEWNSKNCRICSEHFTEEDFERDLQGELLGQPVKTKLKAEAIPTLNLTKTSMRLSIRQDILKSTEGNNVSESTMSLVSPTVESVAGTSTTQGSTSEKQCNILLQNYNKLLSENDDLKKQCLDMQHQNDKLKDKVEMLEKDINHLSSSLMLEKSEEKYQIAIKEED